VPMRSVSWPKPETPSRLWKGPSCRLCPPQPGDLYFEDIELAEVQK
jgi:hypothetical protein